MAETVQFELNGQQISHQVDPSRRLLWVLRSDLGLTGSKYGCGKGQCGSCTVLVDDRAVRSCLLPMRSIAGKRVVTIEGLARDGRLHPVQRSFIEHDALQCGICIPGMIMNAAGLLIRNPEPSPAQIVQAMEGNLCRCGTYKRVIAAVESAADMMKGVES